MNKNNFIKNGQQKPSTKNFLLKRFNINFLENLFVIRKISTTGWPTWIGQKIRL